MWLPDKGHYPKKTWMMIKKTSLMIDELELRREEENKFLFTPEEYATYANLSEMFPSGRPAEPIASAIEHEKKMKAVRGQFLESAKEQKKEEQKKDAADRDYIGGLLLATGTPVMVLGAALLESFFVAGVGIMVAGVAMYLPSIFHQLTTRRQARKRLKKAEAKVEQLSGELEYNTKQVDAVCCKYGIPVNCLEREQYLNQLLCAAQEYERLTQKRTDYELLRQLNGSDQISHEIAANLSLLSGKTIDKETEYKKAICYLEDQLA